MSEWRAPAALMEVDELAMDDWRSSDVVGDQSSKNPLEKMRVRLAAENYNGSKPNNNNYKSINDDNSDDDRSKQGILYTNALPHSPTWQDFSFGPAVF